MASYIVCLIGFVVSGFELQFSVRWIVCGLLTPVSKIVSHWCCHLVNANKMWWLAYTAVQFIGSGSQYVSSWVHVCAVFVPFARASLCGVRWSWHWSSDAGLDTWLSRVGGDSRTTGRYDWTWKNRNGSCPVSCVAHFTMLPSRFLLDTFSLWLLDDRVDLRWPPTSHRTQIAWWTLLPVCHCA